MKGDIVACYDTSLLGKLISFITKSRYSHIAIKITDTLIMESRWNGVKLSKLNDKKHYILLRHINLTTHQKKKIVKFVMENVNRGYDYELFFTIGLHLLFGLNKKDDPRRYICVELITEAYESVGISLLSEDSNETPGDLVGSEKLTIVEIK